MGTEYYLCDREKQEVLYYGKSFFLVDSWLPDPDDATIVLTSSAILRSIEADFETRRMMRAALWCEGRDRVEVMADVAFDGSPPWEESDGGKPFPKYVRRKDWTYWTADQLRARDGAQLWYLEDEGWKPFRLEGE